MLKFFRSKNVTPLEIGKEEGAKDRPSKNRKTSKQIVGDVGEQQALAYLQQQGMQLVEKNFRCKGGEIDLIMQDQASLVFVEVRRRKSAQFGGAAASITPVKQQRMIHAAQVYLQKHEFQSHIPPCRFDAVCIQDDQVQAIQWLRNIIIS